MTTPVWVITGLLDSGKTTLINQLAEQELDELDIPGHQFESGETPLIEQERVKKLAFSKASWNRVHSALPIPSFTTLINTDLI